MGDAIFHNSRFVGWSDDDLKSHIADLEQENERLKAELEEAYNCICLFIDNASIDSDICEYDLNQMEYVATKADNYKNKKQLSPSDELKAHDKYADIRKMSAEDRKEIFDFAMQRSKEILEGDDE